MAESLPTTTSTKVDASTDTDEVEALEKAESAAKDKGKARVVDGERWELVGSKTRKSPEESRKEGLQKAQNAVDAVLSKHTSKISAAIPGAVVKYRGSLASGRKGPHKVEGGKAQYFDPGKFDCDAFIEVPNATWHNWQAQGWVGNEAESAMLNDMSESSVKKRLTSVRVAIATELSTVKGYKKQRTLADFNFRLQPTSKTAALLAAGNVYPEGSLERAGIRERGLPRRNVVGSGAPGRVMPEVHHNVP